MKKKIIGLSLFAIAFGYLEADVVVYLRHLYYKDVVSLFPLRIMDSQILTFEMLREFSTLVIITSLSYISARKRRELPYIWMFTFGVWDIFYYVFLFLMIGWPPSVLSFDILFLIPYIWLSPVICPILISLTLISGSLYNLMKGTGGKGKINILSGVTGGGLILWSFLSIPTKLIIRNGKEIFSTYVPEQFPWQFFIPGLFLIIAAFFFRKK